MTCVTQVAPGVFCIRLPLVNAYILHGAQGLALVDTGTSRDWSRIMLSGDALLSILPWTRRADLSLPMPIFTQDEEQALASVRKMADLQPRLLLPGHGKAMRLVPQVLEEKIKTWS